MPKRLLLALLLAGCSSGPALGPTILVEEAPSPEADLFAPGMIPPECESILQKSQEWGFSPEQQWKPKSEEQAIEVARFLGSFVIIPEKTSRYIDSWYRGPKPATVPEATRVLENFTRAQSCDPFLANTFFDGLFQWKWKTAEGKKEFAKSLHSFVANQQSRTSFLIPRAFSLYVFKKAAARGLMRPLKGTAKDLTLLEDQVTRERKEIQDQLATELKPDENMNALMIDRTNRREMELSEKVRERIGAFLPLP